jgi:integrase
VCDESARKISGIRLGRRGRAGRGLAKAGARRGERRTRRRRRRLDLKPWARALAKAGLPAVVHVHDLRHTGNTLTGEAGASLAELMNRMGHSSTRAARVYLHAREERDRQLATTLDKMARRELRRSSGTRSGGQSGTQRARGRPKGSESGSSDHGQ